MFAGSLVKREGGGEFSAGYGEFIAVMQLVVMVVGVCDGVVLVKNGCGDMI